MIYRLGDYNIFVVFVAILLIFVLIFAKLEFVFGSIIASTRAILASNIANAATPNFKARDLDFDSELKRINKIGNVASTDNRHFSSIQKRIGQDSVFRLPIHPSLDGNTVEMAVEQMQFSENVMRYQTTLTFLNNKISGLKSAIRGE